MKRIILLLFPLLLSSCQSIKNDSLLLFNQINIVTNFDSKQNSLIEKAIKKCSGNTEDNKYVLYNVGHYKENAAFSILKEYNQSSLKLHYLSIDRNLKIDLLTSISFDELVNNDKELMFDYFVKSSIYGEPSSNQNNILYSIGNSNIIFKSFCYSIDNQNTIDISNNLNDYIMKEFTFNNYKLINKQHNYYFVSEDNNDWIYKKISNCETRKTLVNDLKEFDTYCYYNGNQMYFIEKQSTSVSPNIKLYKIENNEFIYLGYSSIEINPYIILV